jgi:hypothetical protein
MVEFQKQSGTSRGDVPYSGNVMVSEVEPCGVTSIPLSVIPAKAGIYVWIPACAGMTLPHIHLSVGLSGVEAR